MPPKKKNNSLDVFDYELVEGEHMLWMGQPDPHKLLTGADFIYIPFTLLWFAFAINGWLINGLFPFLLTGLPFLLVGGYLLVGRFVYKWWRKRNTYYAVTNKRLLIQHTGFRQTLQSFSVTNLPELSKSVGRDGTGSITFGKPPAPGTWRLGSMKMSSTGMPFTNYDVPGFYDITNVNDVYAVINNLRFTGSA